MSNINEILAIVALVIQLNNGQPIGTATGFFYEKNNIVYFITNKHVVLDEEKGIKPDTLRIRLHANPQNLFQNVDFDIPLYKNGVARWHIHKDYGTKKIDIAVIELDQELLKAGHFFKALSASNFLPKKFIIQPAEDVMVIGFPRGLSDSVHNLPLIRNAMISSVYGVSFQNNPFFLIDANLHPGTSGSPVITKPKNMWCDEQGNTSILTGSPMYFLGIHSSTISVPLPAGQEALGLATVWYAYLIEEIIDSFNNGAV